MLSWSSGFIYTSVSSSVDAQLVSFNVFHFSVYGFCFFFGVRIDKHFSNGSEASERPVRASGPKERYIKIALL